MPVNLRERKLISPSPEMNKLSGHVLIFDTDMLAGKVLIEALRLCGLSATLTQTSAHFFAELDYSKQDLIAVDLLLECDDGLGVLKKLAFRSEESVIVTGSCGLRLLEVVRQTAKSYGVNVLGRLRKPYRLSDVRELITIETLIERKPFPLLTKSSPLHARDDLVRAMNAGEFEVHFQPQLSVHKNTLVGFECLVRWSHPAFGLLSPGIFLPWINNVGLMKQLTTIVVQQACKFLANWPNSVVGAAINVPASVCSDVFFLAEIELALRQFGIAPERLVIEVTEAGDEELSQNQIDRLTRIRMRGIRLSLDDFGTGQSSLTRLVKIPFDELKIEKSFVDNCKGSEEGRQVVRALVALARAYSMTVVAEGVEDVSTFNLLRDLGCDVIQGYYIAAPLSFVEASKWMAAD